MAQRPWCRSSSLIVVLGFSSVCAVCLLAWSSYLDSSTTLVTREFSVSYNVIRNVDRHRLHGTRIAEADTASNSNASLSLYDAFDQFSLSPSPCPESSWPLLLLFIFTRPDSYSRRKIIRQTLGSLVNGEKCSSVRVLFVVGKVANQTVQTQLEEESETWEDIVQSTAFVDSYGQATRKGIALIHWSLLNCPTATFTAKADDDCLINLPMLVGILKHFVNEKKVMGLLWPNGALVIRDPINKWAVTKNDFELDRFPPYVSGILYLFHRDILRKIAMAAGQLTYLWHDDVFLTGLAPQKAGVGHLDISRYGLYDLKGDQWRKSCAKRSFLAIHYMDDAKMMELWNDSCHNYSMTGLC